MNGKSIDESILNFKKPVSIERMIDFLHYLIGNCSCRVSYTFKKMGDLTVAGSGVLHRPGPEKISIFFTDLARYAARPSISCSSTSEHNTGGISDLVLFVPPGYDWEEIQPDERKLWKDLCKAADYFFEQE